MADLFAKAGLACLIAAIIGGGLKAFSIEFPLLKSGFRQVVLAITGIALMTVGWTNADASTVSDDDARPAPLSPAPDSAAARRPAPAPTPTPVSEPADEDGGLDHESAVLDRMMGTWVNADEDLLLSAAELRVARTASGATGRMTLSFRLGGQLEERVVGELTPSGELALRITAARVVGNEQLSWPLEGQSLVLTYDAERDMLDGTYRNLANGMTSVFRMRRVR